MENIKQIISHNLTILRKQSGLKQSDVAKNLNYSDKMISKWENGDITPSVENLDSLAKFYGVTVDKLFTKIDENSNTRPKKYQTRNQIIISLLAISVVWIFATLVFVYADMISNKNAWTVFIWAVPISSVIGLIFNSLWGKKKINYIIISIFIWTFITAIYLEFLKFNLVPLYILGIPIQVSVLLWSGLKKSKKND